MRQIKIIIIEGTLFETMIEPDGLGARTVEVLRRREATRREIILFSWGLGRLVKFDRGIS